MPVRKWFPVNSATTALISVAALIPPIYLWRKLYVNVKSLIEDYQKADDFSRKHNCVVMYSKSRIMYGWPSEEEDVTVIYQNISNYLDFLEPILYFIRTTEININIAIMTLQIECVLDELFKLVRRGVRVKIILNLESVKEQSTMLQKLGEEGASILYHVAKEGGMNSIMHHKYMVKDYDANRTTGYVCMGSLNLSHVSSLLDNLEDLIFTSNIDVAGAFHRNFKECWNRIEAANNEVQQKVELLADAQKEIHFA